MRCCPVPSVPKGEVAGFRAHPVKLCFVKVSERNEEGRAGKERGSL